MSAIVSLLAKEPKGDDWASQVCGFLDRYRTASDLPTEAEERAQLKKLIQAAYNDVTFCHCYLSVANEVEDLLDAALEELGAKPYHPVYAPLPALKPLPGPMSAATKKLVLGNFEASEKPTGHGCGYFDGAPWDICYACEYEKDPASYERKIRHSNLVMLISAYFKSTAIGERAKGWSNETLEAIVAYLDTPVAERAGPPRALEFLHK